MHHLAIMDKSWNLIPKIISGQKTIESRWYQTKRAPWNKISTDDQIYFKNSSDVVSAMATVSKVLQFELHTKQDIQNILDQYGNKICLVNTNIKTWGRLPKYCILMFLTNSRSIKPFLIDKTGFGSATAWLTLPNIKQIKLTT